MTRIQPSASQDNQLTIHSLGNTIQKGRIRSPHEMRSLSYWKATSE
jgi:hypothetical protein